YSPNGDIYNLPEGALPLDFAYRVHSDIGKHAYSFKVNGRIQPFDKQLKNGDVVEVVTRKNVHPKTEWLDLVKTSHARDKLRSQLNKTSPIDAISNKVTTTIRNKAIRKKKSA